MQKHCAFWNRSQRERKRSRAAAFVFDNNPRKDLYADGANEYG